MKDTTGEMLTTIIVVIGLVAVMGLFRTFIWPTIKNSITEKVNEINTDVSYVEVIENYNV